MSALRVSVSGRWRLKAVGRGVAHRGFEHQGGGGGLASLRCARIDLRERRVTCGHCTLADSSLSATVLGQVTR